MEMFLKMKDKGQFSIEKSIKDLLIAASKKPQIASIN